LGLVWGETLIEKKGPLEGEKNKKMVSVGESIKGGDEKEGKKAPSRIYSSHRI